MKYEPISEWVDNTVDTEGKCPEGVYADTILEVEYGDGVKMVWEVIEGNAHPNNDPLLWAKINSYSSVVRWRKMQRKAK